MNRDGRDDEDMVPQWSRVPRPSEPTRVGLGVVEGSRARNGDTPPSGVDLGDLTRGNGNGPPTPRTDVADVLAAGDNLLLVQGLRENEKKIAALDDRLGRAVTLGSNERVLIEAKVDECIGDIRTLTAEVRTVTRELKVRDEALFQLLPIPKRVDAVEELAKDLDKRVGVAPKKLEARASSQIELTVSELVELEQGTGLAGVVGRHEAFGRRLAARIGLVAVVASTVPQLALVLLAEGHVLWILYSVAALMLAALSVFAFRRVRRAWRSRS